MLNDDNNRKLDLNVGFRFYDELMGPEVYKIKATFVHALQASSIN